MAEVINLRAIRKSKARSERETLAAENRVKHGRTRAERDRTKAEHADAERHLDAHRLNNAPET